LFQKPPAILKIVPNATCDHENCTESHLFHDHLADFSASTEGRGDSEENFLVTEGNYEEHFNKQFQNKEVNLLKAKINT
jgi:hypothetical protein